MRSPIKLGLPAIMTVLALSSCGTPKARQVPARILLHQEKGLIEREFIGFADDRAFQWTTLIPFWPWQKPMEVIWWCPVSEMNAGEVRALQARRGEPKLAE